jgi:hypothetical protein
MSEAPASRSGPAVANRSVQDRLPAYHVIGVKLTDETAGEDEDTEWRPHALLSHLRQLVDPDAAHAAVARLRVVEVPVLAVDALYGRGEPFRDTAPATTNACPPATRPWSCGPCP